jgi:tetratricopeptide (TPR) repeat protein
VFRPAWLRAVLVLAALIVAVVLGGIQLASSAAYGDLAVRPSLPALLHARAPALLRSLVGDRRARAAAALHDGDLAAAERMTATLPDDPGSADLRGRIAEARGDRAAAIAAYVRSGDVVRAQRLIDAVAAADPVAALADQQRLVAALRDDPNASEVAGEAWWRLGQLQAAAGYRDASRRSSSWRDAEASYERALELAPNEETYLLAAAYQSLANGDVAASQRFYAHAAASVPNSADAYAGLAWTAAAASDCARARANLNRARALRAGNGTAPLPRDPLDDPIAGPALRRCTT